MLAGTIPSFERFMTSWEKLAKKNQHLAPAIKVGLKFAYKYYNKMDDTSAYMVAMCESYLFYLSTTTNFILVLHPGIHVSWMREHWESQYFKKAESTLKKLVSHSNFMLRNAMTCYNTDGKIPSKVKHWQDSW